MVKRLVTFALYQPLFMMLVISDLLTNSVVLS